MLSFSRQGGVITTHTLLWRRGIVSSATYSGGRSPNLHSCTSLRSVSQSRCRAVDSAASANPLAPLQSGLFRAAAELTSLEQLRRYSVFGYSNEKIARKTNCQVTLVLPCCAVVDTRTAASKILLPYMLSEVSFSLLYFATFFSSSHFLLLRHRRSIQESEYFTK